MPNVDRYSVIRLTRPVDGKGVAGQEYLIISTDGYPVALFPDRHDTSGTHGGWRLHGANARAVTEIGLDPENLSGWNLYNDSYEFVHLPSDPGQWFRVTYMGETPQIVVGSQVTHRDLAQPCTVVYVETTGAERAMVHAPAGYLASRERGGWSLASNATREQQDSVRRNVEALGIDIDTSDTFWWVRKDLATVAVGATATPAATAPATSGVHIVTLGAADHCRGIHPVGHEHVSFQHNGMTWALCPGGEQPDPQTSKVIERMGVDPNHRAFVVPDWNRASRRELTTDEAVMKFREMCVQRGGTYDLQSGSIVLPDGSIKWVLLLQDIAIYHVDAAPENAEEIDRYSNVNDCLMSANLTVAQYRMVRRASVRWRFAHIEWALVVDTALGNDAPSKARRALIEADAERERYVEVLSAGAKRLGMQDNLPKFIDEIDLGPLTDFTIDSPLTGVDGVFMRTVIKATSRASALRMAPEQARRGTFEVYSTRNIAISGTPVVR